MFSLARKSVLAAALGATMLAGASPAFAGDRRERHDDVAGAVVLGVLTVAAVAVLAGGKDRRDRCEGDRNDPDYCYDDNRQGSYQGGYYQQGGYYEDDGDRRDHGEGRHRGRHHRGHDRDCDDDERGYDRGDYQQRGYNQGW